MMFNHGLRLGEALALRYVDIDLKNQTASINGSITRKTNKGIYERKDTKNHSSNRIIYIGPTTKLIQQLYLDSKKIYGFNDKWYISGGSKPLMNRHVDGVRGKYIELHNLKKINNHDMRHAFVTNSWSTGVPISAVSKYIGHKNLTTTLDTYSHLTKKDNDKMVDFIRNQK